MRRLLYKDTVGLTGSLGLLPLRVVMGLAFILHGWPKIQNPMGWMPADSGYPGILLLVVAVVEFVGGMALVAGLLTRVVALALIPVMLGAIHLHMGLGDPFVATRESPRSYELAAVYLACSILFLLLGPGRLSLDDLLFRKRPDA